VLLTHQGRDRRLTAAEPSGDLTLWGSLGGKVAYLRDLVVGEFRHVVGHSGAVRRSHAATFRSHVFEIHLPRPGK